MPFNVGMAEKAFNAALAAIKMANEIYRLSLLPSKNSASNADLKAALEAAEAAVRAAEDLVLN